MARQIKYNGVIHQFPDDFSDAEVSSALSGAPSNTPIQNVNPEEESRKQQARELIKSTTGAERTPLDTLIDIGAGTIKGLGKAGQSINQAVFPGRAQQIDFNALTAPPAGLYHQSVGGNVLQGGAQLAPYLEAGAAILPRLPGLAAGGGMGGFLTAEPEQENLFGLLPKGRVGSAIENALLPLLTMGISKLYSAAQPQKVMNALMEKVSGGKTIPENISELSKRLSDAQKAKREEALLPKREIMASAGERPIIPEISKGQLTSEALVPERKITGDYLKLKNADEHYSPALKEAHEAYSEDPTFKNSDKLRSKLFKRINELKQKQKARTISDNQESELSQLIENRNAIIKDQEKFIKTLSHEEQGKYAKFNKTWRENVRAYEEAGNTIKNMKNGFLQKITPQKITNAMAFPELNPQLNSILKDIGPEGINNIIYNAVGKARTPSQFLEIVHKLETDKGFAPYLTPEFRKMTEVMRKQIRNKNFALYGGGGLAALLGIGGGIYKGIDGALNALNVQGY